ncbi:MAG: acyltransferase [Flavobacteriales bacterium]|nr:acyltransferase [Flavobacteriales bacterium]
MRKLLTIKRNLLVVLRGVFLRIYLQLLGCKAGGGLRCHQFPRFRTIPKGNITLGNNVTIGFGITFEIYRTGHLTIGSNVNLTQNIILSSNESITIGDNSLIGENVSIRDGNHETISGKLIRLQPLSIKPVFIGEDVWIGAGCRILEGARLANGVVLGANSVATHKTETEANGIYVGAPIRLAKNRASTSN